MVFVTLAYGFLQTVMNISVSFRDGIFFPVSWERFHVHTYQDSLELPTDGKSGQCFAPGIWKYSTSF